MLHLSGNVRQWIVGGLGGAADERVRQAEFDARSIISRTELLTRLSDSADEVLAKFDVRALLRGYRIQENDVTASGSDLSRCRAFLNAHRPDNSPHEASKDFDSRSPCV